MCVGSGGWGWGAPHLLPHHVLSRQNNFCLFPVQFSNSISRSVECVWEGESLRLLAFLSVFG